MTPAAEDSNVALIPDDAELDRQPLALLQAEIARIEKLVSTDRDTANKFTVLSKRITEETIAYERLREKLVDCEGARLRVQVLVGEREASYKRVFDAIVAEEGVLRELYSSLMARLEAAGGTASKLSFSVRRVADVARWAAAGEQLLDLRRQGPFKGKGALQISPKNRYDRPGRTGTRGQWLTRWERSGPSIRMPCLSTRLFRNHSSPITGNGPSSLQNGSTVPIISGFNIALTMMAWIFESYLPVREGSSCCCCTLRSMTQTTDR